MIMITKCGYFLPMSLHQCVFRCCTNVNHFMYATAMTRSFILHILLVITKYIHEYISSFFYVPAERSCICILYASHSHQPQQNRTGETKDLWRPSVSHDVVLGYKVIAWASRMQSSRTIKSIEHEAKSQCRREYLRLITALVTFR